tara:strand:- start:1048 stop:1896 length:849 start_codon:yes stop_codon:yes gene_type:complete
MLKDIHRNLVEQVLECGIAKSHIRDIFNKDEIELFNSVIEYYNDEYLANPNIIKRINDISSGNPPTDTFKWFEIQQNHHLKRGLNLTDGNILNLYLCETLVDMAEYFHHDTPKLRNVLSFIHPQSPATKEFASQIWHRDGEDFRIFKAFIYLNDVTVENGALNYIKHSQFGGKWQSITDNIIGNNYGRGWPIYFEPPKEDVIVAEGDVGSIFFVNTHGLHKGGFVRQGIRCMTAGTYLNPESYAIIGEKSLENFNDKPDVMQVDYKSEEFHNLSDKQKLVLS